MHLRIFLLALCLSINGLSHAQQPAAAPHTFTATDGRKLTATIVGKTDTTVTIRRAEDGQEFVLPLERISGADQALVKAWGTKPVPPATMPPANSAAVKEITVETPEGKVDLEIWVVEPKWDGVVRMPRDKNHLKLIFASLDGAMHMLHSDGRDIRSKTLRAGDYLYHFGGSYWVTIRGGFRDGKYGLFDVEADAFCIEPIWGKLVWSSYSEEFEAGVIWARKEPEGPEWVILDFAGNEKKRVTGLRPFKHENGPRVSRPDGKTIGPGTLISVLGEKLADWPWEWDYDYHDGYLAVRGMANGEEKWGFVDREGTIVVPPTWDYFPKSPQAEWGKSRSIVATFIREAFPSGLVAVAVGGKDQGGLRFLGGKRGFLNKAGELVIPAVWDDTYGFRDGIALVQKDGLWGIISTTGEVLAEPQWEEALPLSMRRVWIRKGDKWGMVNETGAILGKIEWDCESSGFIDDFMGGVLRVKKDEKTVWLRPDGKELPDGLSLSGGFNYGVALAKDTDSGRWVLIDHSGKRVYRFPDGCELNRDAGSSSSSQAYIEKDGKFGAIIVTPK